MRTARMSLTSMPTMVSTARKAASVATAPLAFIAAFLLAFLAMGAADALAQPAPAEVPAAGEPAQPEHGYAPPSDPDDDAAAAHAGQNVPGSDVAHGNDTGPAGVDDAHGGHGEHGGGHGDPSKHFNFFNFSYSGKDVAGGKFGDGVNAGPHGTVPGEEEPMSAPFVLMVLNFVILVGILAWKGGPIARKMAAERHDQIKDALDEAAKLREQAAAKLAEYETRLKDADAEIARMAEGMRKDAEADKARILEAAERQSAQMKRDAEARIAAEIELARASLTREVTAAATAATERILRAQMQPADQQKLVAAFITDVQAQPAQKERR